MNKQITQRVDSILKFVETSVKDASKFAKTESPAVIQDILRWAIVGSLTQMIALMLAFITVLSLSISYRSIFFETSHYSDSAPELTGWIFAPILQLAILFFGIICSLDWLKALIAPRVYLIEYAKDLVTPSSES